MEITIANRSFEATAVWRVYFDPADNQATVFSGEGNLPFRTQNPTEYRGLYAICKTDVDGLRSKAYNYYTRSKMFEGAYNPIESLKDTAIAAFSGFVLRPTPPAKTAPEMTVKGAAPPVTAAASPAPAPERVNLWTAVQTGHYDSPKDEGVRIADRVVGALERDKPSIICVGNVLYYREDKAIADAKELRERAATLISSLRTVVDEAMFKLRSKPAKRPRKVSVSIKPKPKKTAAKKGARRR